MQIWIRLPTNLEVMLEIPAGSPTVFFEQRHKLGESGARWAIIIGPIRVLENLSFCPHVIGFDPSLHLPHWATDEFSWTIMHDVTRSFEMHGPKSKKAA